MARNITENGTTSYPTAGPGEVFIKVTGMWDGGTLSIQTDNGATEFEEYPEEGAQNADFARWYTLGGEGLQLVLTGATAPILWAQVLYDFD